MQPTVQQVVFTSVNDPFITFERPLNHRESKTANSQQIIAIDGEGYNDEERDHHYDLICAAGIDWNKHLWAKQNTNELTATEIFDFLLGLTDVYGKALYFIYGGSYDFNMWAKRLPDYTLKRLNERGKARYSYYTIEYRPRREIIISDRRTLNFKRNSKGKCTHTYKRSIHIYDVIGFYQQSFVKALKDWNITDNVTVELITSMKLKRGQFDKVDKQDILKYCLEECRLLVHLGTRLRDATIRADIKPRHWYGAGALASSLMMQYTVKQYIADIDPDINRYMLHAYFGGRTDISYVGFMGSGYHYDISSAYPTAMVDHPCLRCGKWVLSLNGKDYTKQQNKFSVWHVKWEAHKVQWGPFPYRLPSGSITYPCCGEGYYHRVEIEAAIKLYPWANFQILDGVIYKSNCNHQPYHFIPEKAAHRLALKAAKDAANKPLKLGLNSLYGKTAQTLGGHNRKPPYQSFYWAGFTTAITRAKMLDAIRTTKGTIYSIATDGLISSDTIPVDIGPNLGQWECTQITSGLLVKPGVYKWLDTSGIFHYGTRGFTSDEANWDQIEEQWRNHRFAGFWEYTADRFIGLRHALHRGDKWRMYYAKWIIQTRKLRFMPELERRDIVVPITGKFPLPDFGSQEIPEFCELLTICRLNSPVSGIYRKIVAEEQRQLMNDLIDEEQPF